MPGFMRVKALEAGRFGVQSRYLEEEIRFADVKKI